MAKQLNLLGSGQIIPTALHAEMERSYLEYAMSVIVGRALPDVRDGLKPVHRRILYAMHELGLTPDRPFRKCARVVGDVLGKYHPHGDQAVYDALVRMVQAFSSRYPLLAGHGNFGSVDNDPPAAMRYTETRLAAIASQAMLGEIGDETVNFIGNFDNSQQEPVVLPAQLPILLINGCSGIAVGMATNVPPHNLGEIVDGLIALIDKPDLSDEKLWKLIPGPDFPTGGQITCQKGVEQAYRTGRGTIPMRGIATITKIQAGKRRRTQRNVIVVTELPYQVNKAGWIEKTADLVNSGRLEGISDIRDESDRDGMRVVIELKRDTNPKALLDALYKQTALESNFGAILLALVNKEPRQLSLRQILDEFINFREETLTKRYSHELDQCQTRLHLIEGLLAALNNLDRVIEILRNAPDGSTAKISLQEELAISESQADSILAMPLRRLTGLEQQKLQTEFQELQTRIAELEKLLGDRHELLKAMKKDLRSLKRKYGDERRTRIVKVKSPQIIESKTKKDGSKSKVKTLKLELPPSQSLPEDAVLEVTNQGYCRWTYARSEEKLSRSIKKGEDFVVTRKPIGKEEQLVVITSAGKAYPLKVENLPSVGRKQPKSLLELLPKSAQNGSQSPISSFFLPDPAKNLDLVLLTQQGRIKRIAASELASMTGRGMMVIKLKDNDVLSYGSWTQEGEEVAIATTGGRLLRFSVNNQQLSPMGRSAQGNQALRLRYGEEIAGFTTLTPRDNLLLVSQQGYVKRLPINSVRLANRGDIGAQALQFASKEDSLVGIAVARKKTKVALLTSNERGMVLDTNAVTLWGKDGTGDKISKLKSEETIVGVKILDI